MAKTNSKVKAYAAKMSRASQRGVIHLPCGKVITVFKQGYNEYHGGMPAHEAYRIGGDFYQGWKNAFESDKKFYDQCSKPHVRASIEERIHKAYGIAA